jgi:protoporphyrinogen/coproporphyrinogen III oxidase
MLDGIIVGGGISGLAVAHWLRLNERSASWELWEASSRVGGTIGTDRVDGYSFDWGPNGFLDREPLTLRLVREAGLDSLLEPANEKAEKRFIAKRGRLHPVPFSPPAMLRTGLLGPMGKLRIFAEPFVAARRDDGDESVFDFAARRIGRAAAETFVDPMVSGVFGGVARQLSLPSCFPIMRDMEKRYGGLVRALIARSREKKRAGGAGAAQKKSGGPAGPGGRLTSFSGGLDTLTEKLHRNLSASIRTDCPAVSIRRNGSCWAVTRASGETVTAANVVLACPAFVSAQLLSGSDPELAAALDSIPYAAITVVATGHRRADIARPLDGFGFLIPRGEGLRTLGSIWTSSIFADRAPRDHVQFRTMLGGAGDPDVMRLSDDELWETIRRELDPFLGIRRDPVIRRVYRWQRGIPQFTLGHRERRAEIERLASLHPGLHMVGNAFYGVGLNDCVKMAWNVAGKIESQAATGKPEAGIR